MRWELVIFDCDGVLIDSEMLSVRADQGCLAECGIGMSVKEILERYTGVSFAGMAADIEARRGPLPADFAERHSRRLWPLFERELQATPGVVEVLDSLACKICVASSGRPERLKFALSLVNLYDRFQPHIFSAVASRTASRRPISIFHAAARMGVARSDVSSSRTACLACSPRL